jgi:tetratricopeptide (TPR) repeat protein
VAEGTKPAAQNAPATESGPPRPSIEAAAASAAAAAAAAAAEPAPEAAAGEIKKKSRFGGDDALGDAAKKKGKGKSKGPVVKLTPEQQKAAEIRAFCDKARDAIKRGEEEVARGLLESLVAVDLPSSEKKIALTEVAAVYEEKGDLTKTIAILEKLTTVLDSDTEVPVWLLKLGQLYREAGAYQMAISRYYGVIQLAMKVGSSDFQRFQAISRQAQREIANTYFIKGDFDQAQKFYNMALRSDLPKEERAAALFRAAHCTFMRGDMNGAINGLERFLKDFSRHASAAEARYMLATAYKTEGRPQDAYDSVIDLLRDAKSKSEENPKAWAFWQKKAGNEFANDYYQRGEFVNAVTIYQALAAIEESPEWRWPVVYQMGLCFERLRIEPRASECYKYIVDENKRPEFRWRKMPQSVANLVQMASWRVEQLEWDGVANGKLRAVVGMDLSRPVPRGIRP